MAKGYRLGAQALRQIQDLIRRMYGPRLGRRGRSGFARREAKIVRTGTAYTTITAATSTQPGTGEVLLDKIRTDDRTFAEADTEPVTVYNLSPVIFLPGTRLKLGRDQTAFEMDGNQRRQRAVWLVTDRVGSGGADQAYVKAGMDTTVATTNNAWTTAGTKTINWKRGREIETNTAILECEDADPFTYITVKQAGYYRINYSLTIFKTTTDTDAAGVHDVQYGNTQILEASAPAVLQDSTADLRFVNVKNEGFVMIAATLETAGHFDADDHIQLQAILANVSSRGLEAVANHSVLCVQLIALD